MTHFAHRPDAVWHQGRRFVPTIYGEPEGNTVWLDSFAGFKAAGGVQHFNEDQTEIVLTLPERHKFSIQFGRRDKAADDLLAALRELTAWAYGELAGRLAPEPVAAAKNAIAAAEGREIADAPKADPTPVDFEQRRDGWLIAFVPISSAARQWSIDASPKGARWEHERWYAPKNRAPAVRKVIEAEGFTVREG